MKNTTKSIAAILITAATLFSVNVKAQSTSYGEVRFGIGLEAGVPTGNAYKYLSSYELGATARFQVGLSDNLALIATAGYYNMFSKNITIDNVASTSPGLGIVPLKGGIKAFVGKGIYLTGETGVGFETSKDDNTGMKDTKFILSPGLGYASKSWDVGVRYENFHGQEFNYGLVGLRVAYGFRISKK